MKLWLIIIGSLLIQELASVNAVLLNARELGYNLWIIHGIFIVVTSFDIWLGYQIGVWFKQRLHGKKLTGYIARGAAKLDHFMGSNGKKFSLVVLGLVNFPYLNGFFIPWLATDLREAFLFILLGDSLWYVSEWLLILGVKSFVHDPYIALVAVLGLSVVLIVALRFVSRKLFSKF